MISTCNDIPGVRLVHLTRVDDNGSGDGISPFTVSNKKWFMAGLHGMSADQLVQPNPARSPPDQTPRLNTRQNYRRQEPMIPVIRFGLWICPNTQTDILRYPRHRKGLIRTITRLETMTSPARSVDVDRLISLISIHHLVRQTVQMLKHDWNILQFTQ
jgi:hypothetical protein